METEARTRATPGGGRRKMGSTFPPLAAPWLGPSGCECQEGRPHTPTVYRKCRGSEPGCRPCSATPQPWHLGGSSPLCAQCPHLYLRDLDGNGARSSPVQCLEHGELPDGCCHGPRGLAKSQQQPGHGPSSSPAWRGWASPSGLRRRTDPRSPRGGWLAGAAGDTTGQATSSSIHPRCEAWRNSLSCVRHDGARLTTLGQPRSPLRTSDEDAATQDLSERLKDTWPVVAKPTRSHHRWSCG